MLSTYAADNVTYVGEWWVVGLTSQYASNSSNHIPPIASESFQVTVSPSQSNFAIVLFATSTEIENNNTALTSVSTIQVTVTQACTFRQSCSLLNNGSYNCTCPTGLPGNCF